MKNKVNIAIRSIQGSLGEAPVDNQVVEMTVVGDLYEKHGHVYVVYDDNILDPEHPVKTTIKLYDHKIDIKRYGGINHHLTFEADKTHHSHYETPFGILDITVVTKTMLVDYNEDFLDINIKYELAVNDTSTGDAFFELRTSKIS
ncbi:MAG: DUF1934 domain-containing protein [Vallitaleaceae bacterium]|nr:DUF1934 domain-containing protein [Vallitaleaceae bacterium]